MHFDSFEAISFDCYGTLIDWERGLLDALRALLSSGGVRLPPDEEALELFGRLEAEAEVGPFQSYRSVLRDVALGVGRELGIEVDDERTEAFAASVPRWPPFDDTVEALTALGRQHRLAVVSNIDDDLFAGSAEQLGVAFDEVVTAEQVRSYKPGHAHFHEVLSRLDLPRGRLLHVAQSLYHDIEPARALGITAVWVNRRAGKHGAGATLASTAEPDLEVPDLATLAKLMDG